MKNAFNNKINDLVNWSKIAFEHFTKEYYADSLTNMRKSGEAVCKIIILYQFSEAISNNKIGQKSYKELIEVIIKDKLAPRKVINWLETIQIHGNIATHDTIVLQEQAYYGIIALRLLIYWVFIEKLNSTVPEELSRQIDRIKTNVNDNVKVKSIKDERYKLLKEKEALEKSLDELKSKENIEREKINTLLTELNNSENKIKELDTAQQKIKLLEDELNSYKSKADEAINKKAKTETGNKWLSKKNFLIFVIICIVTVLIYFTGKFFIKNDISDKKTVDRTNIQQTDSFNLLIFPFTILQDNPNIKINFEEAVISYIKQDVKTNNLPIRIIYNPNLKNKSISANDAFTEGVKRNAFLIFYGELFEPISNNDSIQLNIKKINILGGKQFEENIGIKSFSKLSDSSAVKIMRIFAFAVNMSIAEIYMNNNKYSEALGLAYKSVPVTKSQKIVCCNYLANCHAELKNYDAAIIELEKYIKLDPDNSFPYARLAGVYNSKKDYVNAEIYYKKALQIEPNNVITLLNYSSVIARLDTNNIYKSKALILKAIGYDSTYADSWFYLSSINNFQKDYKSEKINLLKTLELNPDNINAKYELANLLATRFNELENAEKYLNQILKVDSNYASALYLLANIYNSTDLYNLSKAEYFLKKYNSVNKKDTYSTNYGLGVISYNKKDFKTALTYFNKAYSEKNSDKDLCYLIGSSCYFLKDYANAEKYLLWANELDSLAYETNFNLGDFYFNVEKPFQNIDKAIFYFERELKTYPYDTLSLQWLCTIYNNKKDIKKTREISAKLYTIIPNSPYVHKMYGFFAVIDSDYTKALEHYKKSYKMNPNDANVCSEIASVLMGISPGKNWQEALRFANEAEKLDPSDSHNKYTLSVISMFKGDFQKASEYYHQAVEMDPANKDINVENKLKEYGY